MQISHENVEKFLAPPLFKSDAGQPLGTATLDAAGAVPASQLPVSQVSRRVFANLHQFVTKALRFTPASAPLVSTGFDEVAKVQFIEFATPPTTPPLEDVVVGFSAVVSTPTDFVDWDATTPVFVAAGGGVTGDATIVHVRDDGLFDTLVPGGTPLVVGGHHFEHEASRRGGGMFLMFACALRGPGAVARMYHIDQSYLKR